MNCTQYADVVNKLTHSLKVLEKSKSSTHIKLKSLELVTYNQIVYDTKFAMWPLSMYQKLDKIVTTSIKVITKNMVSYPTSVVYMNEQSMGLGIKQLSIVIQEAKLSTYYRAVFSNNDRRSFIMSSMLARVLGDSHSLPIQGGSYSTSSPLQLRDSWWGTSMIQYLQSITRNTIHHNQANQLISQEILSQGESRIN